ncbi:MAG: hypothetical protein L0H36_02435 [bacterium]|nr:hypothetical protein [bacterium]
MLDRLIAAIAPHHCSDCGQIGSIFCANCKNNYTARSFDGCVSCGRLTVSGICDKCRTYYDKAWCVGWRNNGLKSLIDKYKFQFAIAASTPLADMLSSALPDLPRQSVIVPIPTVSHHIRRRGFDHSLLIARKLAKRRKLPLQQLLVRRTKDIQHTATSSKQRLDQAKKAFEVRGEVDPDKIYVLIDDIVTTGATISYGAKALKDAGALYVFVAVVARQPLD